MKAASPPLISTFSTLAPGYDVLLCDIWVSCTTALRSIRTPATR